MRAKFTAENFKRENISSNLSLRWKFVLWGKSQVMSCEKVAEFLKLSPSNTVFWGNLLETSTYSCKIIFSGANNKKRHNLRGRGVTFINKLFDEWRTRGEHIFRSTVTIVELSWPHLPPKKGRKTMTLRKKNLEKPWRILRTVPWTSPTCSNIKPFNIDVFYERPNVFVRKKGCKHYSLRNMNRWSIGLMKKYYLRCRLKVLKKKNDMGKNPLQSSQSESEIGKKKTKKL